jgi:tetratricopeptide (TPR) repeat protein
MQVQRILPNRTPLLCITICWVTGYVLAQSEQPGGNADRSLELTAASTSIQRISRLIDTNQLEAAREHLKQEIRERGSGYQTHFLEARILFSEKRFEGSLQSLEKSFALHKRDPKVYLLAGMNWVVLDRLDLARPFFEEAVKLAPGDETMHYHLGRYYYTAQHFSLAEGEFLEVVRLNPASVKGYDNLGLALEAETKNDEAVACYRKAIELAERQGLRTEWPYLNLGKLLLAKNLPEESLALSRQAAERNPSSAEVFYVQAKALQKMGKEAEALQALQRSVRNDPKFSEAHYLLGRLYLKQGRKAQGEEEMKIFQSLKQEERKKSAGMGTR